MDDTARRDRYLRLRGAADRCTAAVLLVAAAPVLAAAAIAVRARMGAPVLFRQQRVGQDGRVFTILKLRTMVPDAERLGDGYAVPDLIPPLGRVLRATSIDELPQLWNVVRGDMGIVGPRPVPVEHHAGMTDEERRRTSVPQGLTGLAQVRHRTDAPWPTRIRADLEYVERLGPRLDAAIVVATARTVLAGRTSASVAARPAAGAARPRPRALARRLHR